MKAYLLLLFLTLNIYASNAFNNVAQSKAQSNYYFTENKGQIRDQLNQERKDIDVELRTKNGLSVFVGNASIHYQFSKAEGNSKSYSAEERIHTGFKASVNFTMYRMDVVLLGANKNARIIKSDKQEYFEQYFTDWSGEHGIRVHSYTTITYKEIYPDIDWVLYIKDGNLKHEFIVKEGGDPKDIQIKYEGASELNITQQGLLMAKTPLGTINENAPVSYTLNGKNVSSKFRLNHNILSYEIEPYEGTLIIDPTLAWATYFGDIGYDLAYSVTTDAFNNVYLGGYTGSKSNIATSGAFKTTLAYGTDAFLSKFNSSGLRLWATYYGGSSDDYGSSLAMDHSNNVYLSGFTRSSSGISSTGSHQTVFGGTTDAFLVKFDTSGSRIWASYYGGSADETESSLAIDQFNNVYLGGSSYSSSGIASTVAFQNLFGGNNDAYLVKFDSSGSRIWATYYGGSYNDVGLSVATDLSNNVYLTGQTYGEWGMASSGSHQSTFGGGVTDVFLVKFSALGTKLWSTYYGGNGTDYGWSVTSDKSNNVYIAGHTSSFDNIASTGSFKSSLSNSVDAYFAKFDSSGARIFATYFGDSSEDIAHGIAIDASKNIFLVGHTKSDSGIATTGAHQTIYNGGVNDAFLAQFDSSGGRLWASYYGGTAAEMGNSLALDGRSNIYIAGSTTSTSLIATTGAHKTSWSNYYDAFLAKFCLKVSAGTLSGPDTVCATKSYSLSTTVAGGTFYSKTGKTSISGVTLNGLSIGKDTILYIIANTCSADTVAKEIWINPAPSAGIITVKDTLCLYDSASISSGVGGGTWISATAKTVVSGGFVKALTIGSDTLLYLVTNSCGTDTAVKYIETIHCSTNIRELTTNKGIEITPNPAQSKININAVFIIQTIRITNILGETIYSEQCKQKNRELDISTYPKGLYLIKINDCYALKLIKE